MKKKLIVGLVLVLICTTVVLCLGAFQFGWFGVSNETYVGGSDTDGYTTQFDGEWMLRMGEMEWCEETNTWGFGNAGIATITNGFMDFKLFEDIYTELSIAIINGQAVLIIHNTKDGFFQAFFLTHCEISDTLQYHYNENVWCEDTWQVIGVKPVLTMYLVRI